MELYHTTLSLQEKLEILSDAAKYDVSCTSSGVDRRGKNRPVDGYAAVSQALRPVPPASATVLPGTADVSPC